jgi:3-hydroxypropanoate dehydrogenase
MSDDTADAQQSIRDLRNRVAALDDDGLDLLFRQARSHNGWQDKPVSDEQLKQLFDLTICAPTANNGQPLRIIFVRSVEAKARLEPALAPGNKTKSEAAPVVAILGYDTRYFEKFDVLFPHKPEYRDKFVNAPETAIEPAFRNGSLQAAFLIMAARALGLDTGPMSGFNNAVVDTAFFAGTSVRSNFLCALGYGDETAVFGRLPRLGFDQVCEIL